MPARRRSHTAVGSGAERAIADVIGEFGRGHIQRADDVAIADQAFHRLAAGSRGVEHQHFVAVRFQHRTRTLDRRRGVAEHRRGDQRTLRRSRIRLGGDHSGDGGGGVGVDRAADAVDTRDVHN